MAIRQPAQLGTYAGGGKSGLKRPLPGKFASRSDLVVNVSGEVAPVGRTPGSGDLPTTMQRVFKAVPSSNFWLPRPPNPAFIGCAEVLPTVKILVSTTTLDAGDLYRVQ
jgi:hypothetical protein